MPYVRHGEDKRKSRKDKDGLALVIPSIKIPCCAALFFLR
jgi:hypothetical protein